MSATTPSNASAVCDLVGAAVAPADALKAVSLEWVDWQVSPGDYWVLAAWAGSGKGDLLATLAGLQRPVAGRCLVLGRDLYRLDQGGLLELRRHVGFVFGDGGRLFHDLTLAENVALPVSYHTNRSLGEVGPEIEELLTATELTGIADRLPAQVDRQWQERTALARALAMKPELLLLANPIAGFDGRHVLWWREFLAQLNDGHAWFGNRPLTLILATEDLRPWGGHAKQFAVIRDRRLITFRAKAELAACDEGFLREWQNGTAYDRPSSATMKQDPA